MGITGSVGKTTTKDLLRQCLAASFRTAASERSFNNELGLPLTLVNAPDRAQWVVLEMGARGLGHIARLTQVARPVVGIVTSAAKVPIGGATVTAIRAGGGIRSTISASDGIYSFADGKVLVVNGKIRNPQTGVVYKKGYQISDDQGYSAAKVKTIPTPLEAWSRKRSG